MKNIILNENNLHPHALPADYIKLIFQSEFGPGHLIADPGYSSERLINEWRTVRSLPQETVQDIGGGYVRVCVKGMDESKLSRLNDAFVKSAGEISGSEDGFKAKLECFLSLARDGVFAFSYREAYAVVSQYLAGGIRPTSHTERYRNLYRPAYRVVKKEYLD